MSPGLRGSPWGELRSRESPECRMRSALRLDPKHATEVVIDPDRPEGGAEPHDQAAEVQPRHQPTRTRVDLIDVPGALIGNPDGAEGDFESHWLHLGHSGREPVRASVDPRHHAGAATG